MKRVKKIIVWAVLLLSGVSIFAFFHVSGGQIKGIKQISDRCQVTVVKYQLLEWNQREEYVLDGQQIEQLKQLILGSSFTRVLSDSVRFSDRTAYDITVDFQDGQHFLSIHCLGGEYLSVTDQFGGKHLKNNNREWVAALEQILLAEGTGTEK